MGVPWEIRAAARLQLTFEEGVLASDWGGRVPWVLVYPNTYAVGMSSLGLQTLYGLLNGLDNVVCERAFAGHGADPIVSLESQRELADFAVIGFSLTFELDYWNALSTLLNAGIPVLASDRDERSPLVIAGGPAITANPEPMADFLDAIVIGDAEEVLPSIAALWPESLDLDRAALLAVLAEIPGVYVPSVHWPTGLGTPPVRIERRVLPDLDSFPAYSRVLSSRAEFGKMFLIEIARGCARQCHFCLAGQCYAPERQLSLDRAIELVHAGLEYRNRIGLVGAAVSDYDRIDDLVVAIERAGARVSVSSLRADSVTDRLLAAVIRTEGRTVTLAPEVGTQRLSRVVGKGIDLERVRETAEKAARIGAQQIKLYFMIGLPGETDEDINGIVDTVSGILISAQKVNRGSRVVANISPFVPKAHTVFESVPMLDERNLAQRLRYLKQHLSKLHVAVRGEHPGWSTVQATIARGDRRVGQLLLSMAKEPNLNGWRRQAADSESLTIAKLHQQWPREEAKPWQVVSFGPRSIARSNPQGGHT